jgi:hypothetical protein
MFLSQEKKVELYKNGYRENSPREMMGGGGGRTITTTTVYHDLPLSMLRISRIGADFQLE